MFTGIVEATARVLEVIPTGLVLERPASFDDVKMGSSICVSGVCLTIVELFRTSFQFDVVPETFSKSTLGSLKAGDRVNVERALSTSGRFDGYIVQGHAEGTATVTAVREQTLGKLLDVEVPSNLQKFMIPRGSVTLDGVALTVASVQANRITIALIPETLERTTLGGRNAGDLLNIETDILIRAVLQTHPS